MRSAFILFFFLFVCGFQGFAQEANENNAGDPFSFYSESGNPAYPHHPGPRVSNLQNADEGSLAERLRNARSENKPGYAAKLSGRLAELMFKRGANDSALYYFRLSEILFKNSGNARGQAAAESAIGLVYENIRNPEQAELAYLKAIQNYKTADDKPGLIWVHNALGRISEKAKNFPKAQQQYLEASGAASASGNKLSEAEMLNKAGQASLDEGNDSAAIRNFQLALERSATSGDKKFRADLLRNIGIVKYKQGKYDEALDYFSKSLREDSRIASIRLVRDTYLKLFAASKLKNDPAAASGYNRLYRFYKDTLDRLIGSRDLSPDSLTRELQEKRNVSSMMQNNKEAGNLDIHQLQYNQRLTETELERLKTEEAVARMKQERLDDEVTDHERDERIRQLEKEKAVQELAISKELLRSTHQRQWIIILSTSAALVFLFLLVLFYRYRIKKRSHDALDKAYSELNKTHIQLKATKEQLIHSEKMASLGQMTAGIAHEIQNPLNFVNNFSETSLELAEEYIQHQDANEKDAIVKEISDNLRRIMHHGKRADSIVKNMLRHSRAGASEKQSTDLNKLSEEYLQLAFHGVRALDPLFKCALEVSQDPSISPVPVIPQDISRVFLNLFHNAFYAVNSRAKEMLAANQEYIPQVTLNTVKLTNYIAISVKDNGTGIPDSLKAKIFQPFFTTKPTGEGTGLGLSLSFDIIKAHGGELRVDSKENEGTSFTVLLPMGKQADPVVS